MNAWIGKRRGHAASGSTSERFFRRFLLALLLVNITSIAALTYVAYSHSIESITNHARASISQQVDILASKFDREYRMELERAMRGLVDSAMLDDYLLGSDAERLVIGRRLEKAYKRISEESPNVGAVSFVDAEGKVIVEIRDGIRVRSRRNLLALDASRGDASPTLVETAKLFSRVTEIPLLLFSGNMEWFMPRVEIQLAGPIVVGAGDVRAVAALSKLDVDTGLFGGAVFIEQRFDRLLNELRGLEFFDVNPVWVLGPEGRVLSAPKDNQASLDPRPGLPAGLQPRTQLLTMGGGIVGFRDLTVQSGQPFLRLVVSLPEAALLRDLTPAINFFSGVLAVAIILIATLSYWISRYLARPVKQLEETQCRLAHAQRLAQLGHWELDETGHVFLSEEASSILGRVGQEPVAFDEFMAHVHEEDRARVDEGMCAARSQHESISVEHKITDMAGRERFVRQEVGVESRSQDARPRLAGTLQDITERREAENRIESLAYYDQVTGLGNRTLLNKMASQALARARQSGHSMAIIFLDLDHFKRINDTVGHEAGDELLRQVGERLRGTIRPGDAIGVSSGAAQPDPSVVRFGGDEFILMLNRLAKREDAHAAAARIRRSLTRPFEVNDRQLYVTGSLGISVYPDDGTTIAELLRHADTAMYKVKNTGRNNLAFFHASMDEEVASRVSLETRLHQALQKNQFTLVFQPRVDLSRRRIIAFEALIRWIDEDGTMISPMHFIKVAEETGLIIPIGEWVMREACHEAGRWRCAGWPDIGVSINISPAQFASPGLIQVLENALRETALPSDLVELEVTETVLFEDAERGVEVARDLKSTGVKLSVDDFGTGYSSLGMLKHFPVDTIKIDKSFVRDITTSPDDGLIVETAVNLGKNLGLRVVAEGIETSEQLDFLRNAGCDEGQGYLFGRPVAAEDLTGVLKARHLRDSTNEIDDLEWKRRIQEPARHAG